MRRTSIAFIAAVVACSASALAAVDNWDLPRYNQELNPVVADTAPPFTWNFTMGGGTSASPTVSGDTVYVASNDHHIYALNLHTGALRWSVLTSGPVMTAPVVHNGVVVAGSGNEHP
ncbi:MAG TPA: PQQ-binding-like beta-propeller repeat protein, partial [Candidatus Aquilonibacter sp.]|nr:PQQ-binding-like beta-propeller repeat protein [Candidatus Aquilonibacter sp.]